ncbi:MAG TPA: hypothetical protein DEQ30_02955 [Porphyromonadaceae bacterium]|nr:hypothetical protein [Porphyromonadaceae bacterium]
MKTKETCGVISARSPISDVLKLIPSGAELIAAAGNRSENHSKIEMVYSHNGSTVHLSLTQEGGVS